MELKKHLTVILLLLSVQLNAIDSLQYKALKNYLLKYEEIRKNGGWPGISYVRSLQIGDVDKNIPAIKKRLTICGDLISSRMPESDTFDLSLETAVKRFQLRHNLKQDGIIGKRTVYEMNIPIEKRIYQIKINLMRWQKFNMPDGDYILVNVAAQHFELKYRDSTLIAMKVIVGRPTRKTPNLSTGINQIEINPYWIIPPRIAKKNILPKIKKDNSFLISNGIRVYAGMKEVDPDKINWAEDSAKYRYIFIQEPGATNPMGKIKFTFPNQFYVYLHDTPNKELFDKEIRAFSSGCIRMENAFELAYYIFEKDRNWSRAIIDSLIDTKNNIKIQMNKPMSVHIAYFTSWVDSQGLLNFVGDIYRKDFK